MKTLLIFLALAISAWGTACENTGTNCIAYTSSSSGASASIDTSNATLLVSSTTLFAGTPSAPSDSAMNSWTCLTNYARGTSNLRFCYVCGPTTSTMHTFTPVSGTIVVVAYKGTATTSCFDSGQDSGTTTTCNPCTSTITPSVANAGYLVISGMSNCVNESPTVSDNQGNTIVVAGHVQNACVIEDAYQAYRNYNSTSTITVSWAIAVDFAATASAGFLGPAAPTSHGPNGGVFVTGP